MRKYSIGDKFDEIYGDTLLIYCYLSCWIRLCLSNDIKYVTSHDINILYSSQCILASLHEPPAYYAIKSSITVSFHAIITLLIMICLVDWQLIGNLRLYVIHNDIANDFIQ